jgi:MATE family multidrug resistance protein
MENCQLFHTFAPMTIDRDILRIALPSIVSNITVPLLGLMDVAITGHLGAASYIGAIAIGSMVFNVMYWLFGFLRMGSSGLTSQALGRRDLQGVVSLLVRAEVIAMVIALAFLLFAWPLRMLADLIMSPSAEVRPLFHTYFNICIWGAPASLGLYSLSGWFIGMQNSRSPMVVAIFQNVVNMVVSLFLVVVCGMKVEGVALGTLIAQWSGFLLALGLCWKYYGKTIKRYRLTPDLSQREEGRENLSVFFRVNRDIFLRTLCLASVMLFFTSAGSRSGDIILAVNTLLMQFYLLFSYVMDGFAFAGEALSGKRKGAGNYVALHATVRRLFRWGAVLTVAFTVVYVLCGQLFVSLLTDDGQVRAASADYLPWAVAVPAFGVMAFLWDGVFIGMTLTRGMLVSSFVATLLFFALYVLLFPVLGNHGLWIAFMVYLLMRGVIQTFWFRYVSKE